jgi:hypothetical protein
MVYGLRTMGYGQVNAYFDRSKLLSRCETVEKGWHLARKLMQ